MTDPYPDGLSAAAEDEVERLLDDLAGFVEDLRQNVLLRAIPLTTEDKLEQLARERSQILEEAARVLLAWTSTGYGAVDPP